MGKGLKVTGLVLGIISIVLAWIPIITLGSLPMAIIGLILAVMGNKKEKSGLGTAAFVICVIAVVLSAIGFLTCGVCTLCVLSEGGSAAGWW